MTILCTMKSLQECLKSSEKGVLSAMEVYKLQIDENIPAFISDYSDTLKVSRCANNPHTNTCFEFVNCDNNSIVYEGSFNRLMSLMKETDFCIISAYRSDLSKQENIKRNNKLIKFLVDREMRPSILVGHWLETPEKNKDYKNAPKDELIDAVERSLFVPKPNEMSYAEFKKLMIQLMNFDGREQNSMVLKHNSDVSLFYNDGTEQPIGDLNQIGQAYSQSVQKPDLAFEFIGVQHPVTNNGRFVYTAHTIKYFS